MRKNKMNKIVILLFFIMVGSISKSQSLEVMTYNIRLDVAIDGKNAWPFRKEFLTSQIQFSELLLR